jgi:SAM-dependent methyltransferase
VPADPAQPAGAADRQAKELTQQRFGRYNEGYISSKDFAAAPELPRLVEMASPQPHWRVLDVATGGGHTALAFLPHVQSVIASDLTAPMLASARAHARQAAGDRLQRLAFHQVDAEDMPYPAGSFHLVTCRIAPHHFPQVERFVQESARLLLDGGVLLIQDHQMPEDPAAAEYINNFERLRDPSHQRGYALSEWESMLTQAGLRVRQAEMALKTHRFLPFVQRQGCSPEVTAELQRMLLDAPPAVRAWRVPRGFEGALEEASFDDPHLLLAAVKG